MLPVWTYALGGVLLEKRVWMVDGENTSCVSYRLTRGEGPIDLELVALATYRDFHSLRPGPEWRPEVDASADRCRIHSRGEGAYTLRMPGAAFIADGRWWWNFFHREEASRGLDARSDLFAPGAFHIRLAPGETATLIASVGDGAAPPETWGLDAARRRQNDLLDRAQARDAAPTVQQLVLAADQFLVRRSRPISGRTIIAGYHWFNDWGRDTMISLPGLTLATGRFDDAAAILRSYAPYVVDGLLPNNFPDRSGTDPGYNTADAALWYILAVKRYADATGDAALAADLFPTLRGIVEAYRAGTRYGIGVDPADGLLRAGISGLQLTWMDAKIGDWVVTPRSGKAVELNALWYNALLAVAAIGAEGGPTAAARYRDQAAQMAESFRARFWREDLGYLADVVDGADGDDVALRPNQIFAVSLPYRLIDGERARRLLDALARRLLTSFGLRSVDPDHPAYRGTYVGDQVARDSAYHQGTAWAWLLGPFAEAWALVHGAGAAQDLLRPLVHHLSDAGLGTISEIFDGDPPHSPRGCVAQAWSVAEVLRVWRSLSRF
jgi:predicted glycogen debranching enzyme